MITYPDANKREFVYNNLNTNQSAHYNNKILKIEDIIYTMVQRYEFYF